MSLSISSVPGASAERRRGRWTALALFFVAALPVVAAYLAFLFWSPARGINYGELIAPQQMPDAALAGLDGSSFRLSGFRGKWLLVQIGGGGCAEECVKRLFLMRQVRAMQGKERDRVQTLWLLDDRAAPDERLLRAYDGVHVGRAGTALVQLFPAPDDPKEHVYLVDPLGNLMLRFPADADPKRVSRDLARLLEVSHVG